jgi:hypothetical protein
VVDFGVQILRTFSLSLLGISLGCITTGMAISCSSPFPAAGAGGSAGARAWAEQKTCGLNPKIVHGLSVLVNLVIHEGKPDYFFSTCSFRFGSIWAYRLCGEGTTAHPVL